MEEKGAEAMTQKAPEKEAAAMACYRRTVGEEATFKERSKDLFRQFKDAPAGDHWVCLKNKVRAAGEYATLRTRQGITMFGEPNVGDLLGRTKDDDSKKTPSA
ncbi:uncharacterized protein [Oryza sativa Japonica Group]|jgi:hypothetical protein|uniref:Expressed protein n=9 Tax=Oryza TaxID=4527 RepID=Q10RP3_ORYSJ|nr:expressed protein [Oryza sativa Japonica Group]KAB8090220.1 hypothetical protein EE612_015346 [Oryza sativa]KAF2937311.1 hypothetical protein DAI22_03g041300 [Oryza sativa Japonica Group]BAF10898.1 Os03g0151500 [Oryza sativa Japonica Group]BAG98626.1 unnamed protein product [Oryza sativa Japonica Group]|eukprot:NP_001048984.1 Os03g0151500 [Oryza sativa Japonica Group]